MTLSYKQIRQFAGFTQEDLAKICNVDRRTVSRFETGKSQNEKLQKWYHDTISEIKIEFRAEKGNEGKSKDE